MGMMIPPALDETLTGTTILGDKFISEDPIGKHKVIKEFHIFDGDPAVNYEYKDGKLYTYNRINPRDGGMRYPEGFFDTVEISLNNDQRQQLFTVLASLNLSNWETDETVKDKLGCPGFSVNRKFSCTFEDGDEYVCYPLKPIPSEFNRLFALLMSFGTPKARINIESQENTAEKKAVDPDVIDLNPNCTTLLFSADDGIRLFSESRGEDLRIYKTEFLAGRSKDCDLHMTNNVIARMQATFMFDGDRWLLRDNQSTNGTWLNETKMVPGKKYVLHPDDVIEFAHTEKFVFFKTHSQQDSGNQAEKAVVFLEAGMKVFHESDHKDETAFKLIVSALVNAPLYLPVSIDLEAMFGTTDPTKLKPGDVIQTQKDVSTKILTINIQDTEYVPMFTSTEQVNKGPSVSTMKMAPQMYLPKVIGMDKDIVINPFGGMPFIFNQQMMKELLLPLILQNSVNVEATAKDELIGKKLNDNYVLQQLLGHRGLFRTYMAKDVSGRKWTVKVCDKTSSAYSEYRRTAIMQEAHMLMKFNHPIIPKVADLIEDEKYISVVREYIEGSTLYELLTQNGPRKEPEVISYGQRLAAVLLYMHRFNPPYIYRDMKPMNVLIASTGDVKLIDFDICEVQGNAKNGIEEIYGTKGYAAPEQFMGQYDPRTDIYSLGITMHQLITGISPNEPPYETPPVRQVKPEISKGLEYVIQKCIARNPDERYQNCEELLHDLNNIQNLPPKKGLFSNLFGKKEKKPVNTAPPINQTVARLYAGMNKDTRDQIFYGGLASAQDILLRLASGAFFSTSEDKIDLCLQIYVQTWIRSRGGLSPQFSTPSYIKEALIQRFSMVPSSNVIACVEQSLDIIYSHEPQLKLKATSIENFVNDVKAKAEKNVGIQDLHLKDVEYGIVANKPVFVNGFGNDKYYLSHLCTTDGVKLSFERIGSFEIAGIVGPVDAYKLFLPDKSSYMTIFICNYGTRTTPDAPKGLVCNIPHVAPME